VWTAPLVDGSHRTYLGARHGHIHGFAPDGHQLFDLDVGATVDSYPALTADGALIVGVTDGRLLAIADAVPCTAERRRQDGTRVAHSPNRPDAIVGATVATPVVAVLLTSLSAEASEASPSASSGDTVDPDADAWVPCCVGGCRLGGWLFVRRRRQRR
jgi:hypothetical protein